MRPGVSEMRSRAGKTRHTWEWLVSPLIATVSVAEYIQSGFADSGKRGHC